MLYNLASFNEEMFNVDCELDGVSSRSTSEVIHASFESLFPCIEMY